jgi:zinc protease
MLCALLLTAATARAADLSPDDDLPQDLNNIYGSFDNGVKFIVRKNANPSGKITLNLRVGTGSLNETAQQNGLAHFLEHMAFKGSKHFAPMRLIPLLSHLGMTFGADTNAHTTQTETVFKLNIPDNKPQTIDTALTIFCDYASELSLYPIQIESERRVILEEARTKKNAAQRLRKHMNQELFPNTPLAIHDVIGDEEQIKTFPQSEFLDYWNTWYRPENMTLVVVGDLDPQTFIAAAQEKLGKFTARGPARPVTKPGIKPFGAPRAVVLSDPEQVNAEVSIMGVKSPRPIVETFGQYRQAVIENVAEWIINHRLEARVAQGDSPYTSAQLGSADVYHEAMMLSISADGEPRNWNQILNAQIDCVHTAAEQGFTVQELELAKRGLLAGAQWAVTQESTQDSAKVAETLIAETGSQSPILSAQQKLDLDQQILSDLTTEQLKKSFNETFDTRNFAYVLILPAPQPGQQLPTSDAILAAATADWNKPAQPLQDAAATRPTIAADPTPGTVVSRETDAQLGITSVVFANGVVMHHKRIDTRKDQVAVVIKLPGGAIEETAKTKGLSALAGQILMHPATRKISSTQLQDQMTGLNVQFKGGIGLDSMDMEVQGSPGDLPRGLELANALLTDGILEPSVMEAWKTAQLQEIDERGSSAKSQLSDAFSQTVCANDLRFTPLTPEVLDRLTLEAAQNWFEHIARHSAIEVSVVGDLSLEQAAEMVSKYIGSLPSRTGTFTDLDALRKLDRPNGPYIKTIEFPGITPTAVVMAGYLGCEETSLDRRPLSLASMILTERMIQRIRIKDNLVYSINCTSKPGQGIPGLGEIYASAPTDPKNADRLADTILEMFKSLADTGPTDQELDTAKKQIANVLQTQMKTPGFWIAQLSALKYHRHTLTELRQVPGVFDGFTTKDIQDTLHKYVVPDSEIRLIASPKS